MTDDEFKHKVLDSFRAIELLLILGTCLVFIFILIFIKLEGDALLRRMNEPLRTFDVGAPLLYDDTFTMDDDGTLQLKESCPCPREVP